MSQILLVETVTATDVLIDSVMPISSSEFRSHERGDKLTSKDN